jgi:3-oxoacyl-[acyl-carrier-protein] synthase-3
MSLSVVSGITVCGISACVAKETSYTNEYEYFSQTEKQDFIKRVGVFSKRDSKGKYTTSDLCYKAAEVLIANLGWAKTEIGIIVLVTQTPDYTMPSSAILLQHKLGLSTNTIAFDINLGCSGWIYGLAVISSMMCQMKINKALLLTGETSAIAEYSDKATWPLMGDAGSATAIIRGGESKLCFNLNTDGSGFQSIIAPYSGNRFIAEGGHNSQLNHIVTLNSQLVLSFCLREVVPSINKLLEFLKSEVSKIDYFVFHQANRIINESLRKKLNIPAEKYPYSISEFGNTSSASIPLTMVTQIADDLRHKNLSMVCSGFGVGLSWGSVFFKTSKITCPELIEM